MPGRFVTFEGIEGVGKSTQIAFARDHLRAQGLDVVLTREPGGTPLGEAVRAILLDPAQPPMCADSELLLVFAARAQHVAEVIRPALARGAWVLSDRFTDATYAYQGGGRGIGPDRVAQIEHWVQGALRPDLTLLLDAAPEVGRRRVTRRAGAADRFEAERAEFFERVRAVYLERAQAERARFRIIDAAGPLAQVQARVAQALDQALSRSDVE